MNFELTVLGTGSATPTLNRNPSAYLLTVDNEYFLIDCGEGTQFRLLEQKIRHTRLRHIFISHLHGDHYFGLIGFISSLNLNRRTEDLTIIAPRGLAEILTIQLKHSETILHFKINFIETNPDKEELILDHPLLTVETIPLHHRIACCGFLFKQKQPKRNIIKENLPENFPIPYILQLKEGNDVFDELTEKTYKVNDYTTEPPPAKSFAYCSDTAYNELKISQLQGVDTVFHEATFTETELARAIKTNHSTAKQAAMIAQKSNAKQLIIGHYSSRYDDLTFHLLEAQEVFANTHLAIEGQVYKI
jgi:ribonuclease Z